MGFKIYTKTGDKGMTGLFGGKRVSKDHVRIDAYGTVDELNSFTGLLRDHLEQSELREQLKKIQNKLFDLGSYLASPDEKKGTEGVDQAHVEWLEKCIDKMEEDLEPLKNFILPGGHPNVSRAHICRTVCRRAERRVVSLAHQDETDDLNVQYLNRLSDYFFTLARFLTHHYEVPEVKWEKGS